MCIHLHCVNSCHTWSNFACLQSARCVACRPKRCDIDLAHFCPSVMCYGFICTMLVLNRNSYCSLLPGLCLHRCQCYNETIAVQCCHSCACTGVDATKKQLLFIAGSTPDARRQVKVPLAAMRDGRLSIRTDLMDAHLYIFHKQTFLKAVQARPSYSSIRQVMIANDQGLFCNLEATSNIHNNTWLLTPTAIMIKHSTLAWPLLICVLRSLQQAATRAYFITSPDLHMLKQSALLVPERLEKFQESN